jgi:hypothetical protein
MTPEILEIDLLQDLPATDEFAADELAGVELLPCGGKTCWLTCLWTCHVTE